MKKKVIGIFVCTMVILSIIIPVSGNVLVEKDSHPMIKDEIQVLYNVSVANLVCKI